MTAVEQQQGVDILTRKKFTRDEVYRMLNAGIFEGQRFELINGDIIDKMGQNPPHVFGVKAVERALVRLVGFDRVRIQSPVEAEGPDHTLSEPEPDVAVVDNEDPDRFAKRHPRGSELSLVVEVSDASLRADRTLKRDLYAKSRVPEYWVLDLNGRQLIVHRKPMDGVYGEVATLEANQSIEFEGEQLPIAKMLPPV